MPEVDTTPVYTEARSLPRVALARESLAKASLAEYWIPETARGVGGAVVVTLEEVLTGVSVVTLALEGAWESGGGEFEDEVGGESESCSDSGAGGSCPDGGVGKG